MGVALVTLGGVWLRWHVRVWRANRRDATLDDRERRHYRAQFLRRVQVAALLILLGLLIPAGDLLMEPAKRVAKEYTVPGLGLHTTIRLARHGAQAGVLGAAMVAAHEEEGK